MTKLLLECDVCATRELIELGPSQAALFRRSHNLWRHCANCAQVTVWAESQYEVSQSRVQRLGDTNAAGVPIKPAPPAVTEPQRAERRVHPRLAPKKMTACIPPPNGFGSADIVEVLDLSKGGMRFRSLKQYFAGQSVQVAVPYTPGNTNIFCGARIVWRAASLGRWTEYGLKYARGTNGSFR